MGAAIRADWRAFCNLSPTFEGSVPCAVGPISPQDVCLSSSVALPSKLALLHDNCTCYSVYTVGPFEAQNQISGMSN